MSESDKKISQNRRFLFRERNPNLAGPGRSSVK